METPRDAALALKFVKVISGPYTGRMGRVVDASDSGVLVVIYTTERETIDVRRSDVVQLLRRSE